MKRNLFLLLFAIATLSTFAQTTSEHLTFKGVPIDGTLTEFVSKLKQKGQVSYEAEYQTKYPLRFFRQTERQSEEK